MKSQPSNAGMKYMDGPLEVTKPDTEFVATIELGQGAKGFVHAAGNLEEAVKHMLRERQHPAAFVDALEELQRVGRKVDWDWQKIARKTTE